MNRAKLKYPAELQRVIGHAERLRELLSDPAIAGPLGVFALGRAEEIHALVGMVAREWRNGALSELDATREISEYLENLHTTMWNEQHVPPCCSGTVTA